MKKIKLITSIIIVILSLNIIISSLYVSNASNRVEAVNVTNTTNEINNNTTENTNVNNNTNMVVNNSSENLITEEVEEKTENNTKQSNSEEDEVLINTDTNNINTMTLEHNEQAKTNELGIKYQSHVSMVRMAGLCERW